MIAMSRRSHGDINYDISGQGHYSLSDNTFYHKRFRKITKYNFEHYTIALEFVSYLSSSTAGTPVRLYCDKWILTPKLGCDSDAWRIWDIISEHHHM